MGGGAKTFTLQKSVVSASGFAQDLKDAPASISIVTPKDLEDRPVRDLGDALSLVPGITTNQDITGNTGYNISIRGMPSQYTLILVDGKRQNVSPAVFPHGADSIFSSFIPPLSAIERIEVIRGPMSTIYGSDAMGGVVNIITKKNFDKWHTNFNLSTTLQEEKAFSNLYKGSFYTAGPLDPQKHWGIAIRGSEAYTSYVSKKDMAVVPTPDGKKFIQEGYGLLAGALESNKYDIGARLSYAPSEQNHAYVDFSHNEAWYNSWPDSVYEPAKYYQNNGILAHFGDYDRVKTDNSIQINNSGLRGNGENYVDALGNQKSRDLTGLDVIATSKAKLSLGTSQLVLGGEYWFSSLFDKDLIASTGGDFLYQNNISLFAENELSLTDDLILTLGFRENYNFAFGFNASPRAYLAYDATDWLTLKGGVSTGYRVPTANQLVNGNYTISGNSADLRLSYGNPDLKPETSLNFELSALSETDYTDMGITGFYNQFKDKILDGRNGQKFNLGEKLPVKGSPVCSLNGHTSRTNNACYIPVNVDEAITYGTEVFFNLKPIDLGTSSIDAQLNYTFTKTLQTKGNNKNKPLLNIPEHNLNGTLNYTFKKLFGLYLRGEFYAKQPRGEPGWLSTADYVIFYSFDDLKKAYPGAKPFFNPYFLLHIGGHYNITKNIRLNVAVYNLLNEKFSDWVDVVYPGRSKNINTQVNNYNYIHEGRRYYVSINMDF
ncbi:TonB-dependent receptor [Helicobacter sp. 11S02596-1]|uniref:TonB-dependent receptor domain-containing protein n=1 Tax=Helicobacter sp. 11S02596-1 TaxID=1476194 RepID=UPI000BA50D4F|nr:TonB-dependent receptor [Helicobacter sp. 11S02596-1]PAF45040.1 hypothetical protein BJI48_00250 [Helicobacter sp. 11S02596-1]